MRRFFLKEEFFRKCHKQLQCSSSIVTRVTNSLCTDNWSAARKAPIITKKSLRTSLGRYTSNSIHGDSSRRNAWKFCKVERRLIPYGDAGAVADNEKRKNCNRKLAAERVSNKSAFSKNAWKRFALKREAHAAFALPCLLIHRRHGDASQEDDFTEVICRICYSGCQFVNCFHVSGTNQLDAQSWMWSKRETHVSFREGRVEASEGIVGICMQLQCPLRNRTTDLPPPSLGEYQRV